MFALLNVPTLELLKLWGELLEAYHGLNGFGSTVAEIYAYRFMRYSPIENLYPKESPTYRAEVLESRREAADALLELCKLFMREYQDCMVTVGDMELDRWRQLVGDGFDHREQIRVRRQDHEGRG